MKKILKYILPLFLCLVLLLVAMPGCTGDEEPEETAPSVTTPTETEPTLPPKDKILIGASLASMLCLTIALFGGGNTARVAFPLVGFFYSVMWSIIFSLALNSVAEHHGSFSGILCTGIIGGAIVPLIIGALADLLGLRFGMMFLYITLGYILSIGFWAKPLISNKTILRKKKQA